MRPCLIALLGLVLAAGPARAAEPAELTTQKKKLSYAIGLNVGETMKRDQVEIEPEVFLRGLVDGLTGGQPLLSEEEIGQVLENFRQEMTARQQAAQNELAARNKAEGEAFLAANLKRPEVKTLPSGLQYRVIEPGTGKSPRLTDQVTAHYRGRFIGGDEFDSSYARGEPATFPLNRVIPAWQEALPLMKEGGKWELFVPSDLAYGERGAGSRIGPNVVLIFEVELIAVSPAEAAGQADETPAKK